MEAGRAAELARKLLKVETPSYVTWYEGSHLKEYLYKITGGTGKYEGASGGGTYTSEAFKRTDTLAAGKYNATIELP